MAESGVLNIHWAYGFSKDIVGGVHSLSTKDRNALFFLSAHSGVIYDFEHRSQMILQGHCNTISCCAVSKDKRWIVTADMGADSILVVWDSFTGAPVKTIFAPHTNGCISVDISDDALYIATLKAPSNDGEPQEVAIWAWTRQQQNSDLPLLREPMISSEKQHRIIFNVFNQSEIATTGAKTVCFWTWEEFRLEGYVGKVSKTDFGHFSGRLTNTIFLGKSGNALTCSDEGYTILWETQYATILLDDANSGDKLMRTASKVLRLVDNTGIASMQIIQDYIAVACMDGAVRFYDYFLRLEAWFEDFAAGPLTSLSFSVQENPYPEGEAGSPGLQFWVPDFIVGTADAFIVGAESALFDEIRAEDRRGTLLMQGMSDEVSAVACHPTNPLVAFACVNGNVHMWDYEMKILINLREFNSKKASALAANASATQGGSNTSAAAASGNASVGGNTSRVVKKLQGDVSSAQGGSSDGKNTSANTSYLRPQCIAFEPTTGEFLAVGFTSGHVKFVNVETLEDMVSYAPSLDTILSLSFSSSGMFLAAYDTSNHVMLWKRVLPDDEFGEYTSPSAADSIERDAAQASFVYIGRILAHSAPIVGLTFGFKDQRDMLISVSQDKYCVEYDLHESSTSVGIVAVGNGPPGTASGANSRNRLELTGIPSASMWHPHLLEDVEDRFVIANNEFKFKEFNADSKQCRKTTLAPTFGISNSPSAPSAMGGAPTRLLPLPLSTAAKAANAESNANVAPRHYVYATSHRVIGVGCFPLTGNPEEVVGLVAHPSRISDLAVSFDGKFVFTSGGTDLSVNMWSANVQPLINTMKHPTMEPFYRLLDEGGAAAEGELYDNIVDYFYLCQIRSHGENVMDPRAITGRIPIGEISTLMRAIGFFPSEEDILNMTNEVRYKAFMTTGVLNYDIDLEDFIKLYVNHRPLFPLNSNSIENAFAEIAQYMKKSKDRKKGGRLGAQASTENDLESADIGGGVTIPWNELTQLLGIEGEALTPNDLSACLIALMGENGAAMLGTGGKGSDPNVVMNSQIFAEEILGFESSS